MAKKDEAEFSVAELTDRGYVEAPLGENEPPRALAHRVPMAAPAHEYKRLPKEVQEQVHDKPDERGVHVAKWVGEA